MDVLASRYIADYIAGKIDRVEVAYMKFLNAARQVAVVETLLPLSTIAPEPAGHAPNRETKPAGPPVEYQFLPQRQGDPGRDPADVVQGSALQVLPGRSRERADRPPGGDESGHGKRCGHDQNADPAIQPCRQAQITKEIAEVIGGAESPK